MPNDSLSQIQATQHAFYAMQHVSSYVCAIYVVLERFLFAVQYGRLAETLATQSPPIKSYQLKNKVFDAARQI